MKHIAFVAFLFLSLSAIGQKYHYNGGYFEHDGNTWAQYKTNSTEAPILYQPDGEMDEYFIITDGTTRFAVPKAMQQCFLVTDEATGEWKFFSRSVDPNAPKPVVRKPGLARELKEKVVKNFRPTTPYDGIHLYTSPFGYLNTPYVTMDDALTIINSSEHYSAAKTDDGKLQVERKGNIGYEQFGSAENTQITGEFENGKIKKCTYVFSMPDQKTAAAAKAHLIKHMGIASKAREGKRYKVAWLKEVSLFDINTENKDGASLFVVEVEYK